MNLDAILQRVPSPRVRSWVERILKFGLGQGALQFLNLVTGFCLLRWLSVEEYAQFGIVLGFQITVAMFVDLGFSGSLIALAGDRVSDRSLVGTLVATTQQLRRWAMFIAIPIAALAFHWVAQRQGWPPSTQILLFSAVAGSLYFEGWMACFSAPLLMHQRLGTYFRAPTESAAGRFLVCALLQAAGWLHVAVLCFVNLVGTLWTGQRYRSAAQVHLEPDAQPNATRRREILRYLAPLFPGLVFNALQGQILIFLSSFFAGTRQVAEVAALGRLGQIVLLLTALNGTIIAPYFAKLPHSLVARRYLLAMALTVGGCFLLQAVTVLFPEPLLWLLGPNYRGLNRELAWVMGGQLIAFTGSVMWAINSSRKWIYWWSSVTSIVVTLAVQAATLWLLPMDSTINLLFLALVTNASCFLVHAPAAFYGYREETRAAAAAAAQPSPAQASSP